MGKSGRMPWGMAARWDAGIFLLFGCILRHHATGCSLVANKTAHAVRYRSRHSPGFPNFPEMVYRGLHLRPCCPTPPLSFPP